MYNENETIQEAIIKEKCGLQLQENGDWMGTDKEHSMAEDLIERAERMEENEVDDLIYKN